jgi:hypothetical protein
MQYGFHIIWPKRWATKGYTSITLGCETLAEARAWHRAFKDAIQVRIRVCICVCVCFSPIPPFAPTPT